MEEDFLKVIKVITELGVIRGNVPQFLFYDSVFHKQSLSVRKEIEKHKEQNASCDAIDFIINSPGGLADDAYRIIRTLRKSFTTVNIIIPFWVKSAATLLSLGGTTIVMDEYGEFGPLDAQLGKERDDSPELERESALNDEHSLRRIEMRFKEMYETMYIRLYEHKKINLPKSELSQQLFKNLSKFYQPLLSQINPYKLGDKRRKLDIGGQYATRILAQFSELKEPSKIRSFVDYLVDGCPDHGYVIDYDLMKMFLPNIKRPDEAFGYYYKRKLSELSMLFIEEDYDEFIGFINPIEELGFINSEKDQETTLAVNNNGNVIAEERVKQ